MLSWGMSLVLLNRTGLSASTGSRSGFPSECRAIWTRISTGNLGSLEVWTGRAIGESVAAVLASGHPSSDGETRSICL
jgi:hypothetical protein